MMQVDSENIRRIGSVLNDKSRPLKERFRALFTLRNIGGPDAIESINQVSLEIFSGSSWLNSDKRISSHLFVGSSYHG